MLEKGNSFMDRSGLVSTEVFVAIRRKTRLLGSLSKVALNYHKNKDTVLSVIY
jgi:hypothetical protein